MILPVISNDGLTPPPADTVTSRLSALSDLVLEVPGGGGGAEVVAGYKAFLSDHGCRVGPFDVLAGDRDVKVRTAVSSCRTTRVRMHSSRSRW